MFVGDKTAAVFYNTVKYKVTPLEFSVVVQGSVVLAVGAKSGFSNFPSVLSISLFFLLLSEDGLIQAEIVSQMAGLHGCKILLLHFASNIMKSLYMIFRECCTAFIRRFTTCKAGPRSAVGGAPDS